MATVHVSNIAHTTSEKEVKDFFSFCGKITDISITPASSDANSSLSATVTFERESAAKTALLLDNTQLGASAVHVEASSTLDDLSKSAAEETGHHDDELRQEDKPRTTILAEYLSHGYVIGDKALQKGIDLDGQHGITTKFTSYLQGLDNRLKATDKARAVDNTYGVQNRGISAYNTVSRYFESALNTPTGQKVRSFYDKGSKQVLDIHNEARRLADLRKAESGAGAGTSTTGEKGTIGEPVSVGDNKTKCQCAGNEGVCKCAPGQCSCAGCQK